MYEEIGCIDRDACGRKEYGRRCSGEDAIVLVQSHFSALIDQKTDREKMNTEVDRVLNENGFERDQSRPELGNIITPPSASEIMGYDQMDYYMPVRRKMSL